MSKNWKTAKISQLCRVVAGGTPSTAKPEYWGGEIPWVTPMDLSKLKGKYIEKGSRNISEKGLASSSAERIPARSIIMSSRAPIGYLAINKQEATTNQGCKSFVCGDDIDVEYLYYYLSHHMDEIKRLGSGSTFAEVGKRQLENLLIEYPDPPTQRKIVQVLSTIDEDIQKIDQTILKSKELKQGLMRDIFSGKIAIN
ncbi:MAG: restriction endonuclease subunit S [Microgenomates group bacterium]